MGVVAHVGGDPDEIRHLTAAHVDPEQGERDDVGGTAGRVVADVVVVHERVVLHRVVARGRAHVAGRRHVFQVGLPGSTTRLHLVGDVGRAHVAGGAVARDPKCAAGGQREVVGQARMRYPVVVRGQAVAGGQPVGIGRRGATDDAAVFVVFHHDHKDV